MYSVSSARFDDLTNHQQGMAGYLAGPFMPAGDQLGCQPRAAAPAASGSLPPILMKASRHDESQTTPRQKAAQHPAPVLGGGAVQVEGRYDQQHSHKLGAAAGVLNINASAVGPSYSYQQHGASAGPSSARQAGISSGAPASARGPLYGGAGAAAAAGVQPGGQQHRGMAEAYHQGSAVAPRPLQLPPVLAREAGAPLPLPTAHKLQPPATSRQPMSSRVVPVGSSPYLDPVPGYSAAGRGASRPAVPPPQGYAAPRTSRTAAPPQQVPTFQQLQLQEASGRPVRPVPTLALGFQPAEGPSPPTARANKSSIYARMSQGLPAVETPCTARAQQLLRQLPAAQQPGHDTATSAQEPQLQPRAQQLNAYAGIPLDSPTSSTGLTPRTARLMQRLPAVPGAAVRAQPAPVAAAQQQQQQQQQYQQQQDPAGLSPYFMAQQPQGRTSLAGPRASLQQLSSQRLGMAIEQGGGVQPMKHSAVPAQLSGEKRQSVDADGDTEMETIKALHQPAAGPAGVGLAALPQLEPSGLPEAAPVVYNPFLGPPGLQAALLGKQAARQAQAQAAAALGSLPEQDESLLGLPQEAADMLVYELQPAGGQVSRLPSNSRPHQPLPPSELSRAESMQPAAPPGLSLESFSSMPQLYHAAQPVLAAAHHASHSAEAYQSPLPAAAAAAAYAQQEQEQQQQQQQQQLAAVQQQQPGSRRSSFQGSGPTVPAPGLASASRPTTASRPPSKARPMRPGLMGAHALKQYEALLTAFEQSEILGVPEVWFAGRHSARKTHGDKSSGEPNYGYDDPRGDYLTVVGDHIAYRYEVLDVLGRGSFGQVLHCMDHATGQPVALKIIRNKRRFQKQAQIEANILQKLQEADPHDSVNIVRTYSSFTFRSHLCITFELLSLNLYEYIKACNFVGSSLTVVRRIAVQVLECLQFLLRRSIVHCDLKPENILLVERGKTRIKVIDFGSSCYRDQRMYTYIQSRFYRSPEVILGLPYGPPIDMWSLGCILAEMLTGQPIFPGEDEKEQLACIMEILGAPPPSVLEGAPRANLFFNMGTGAPLPCGPNSRGKTHRVGAVGLEDALRGCEDRAFIDFLRRCLEWDPVLRMTPDQALQHEWVARASGRTPPPASRLGTAAAAAASGGLYRQASAFTANSAAPLPVGLTVKQ